MHQHSGFFKRRQIKKLLMLILIFLFAACSPLSATRGRESNTATPLASATPPQAVQKPILKTSIGEFIIEKAYWVDEVNGVVPGPEERILLVALSKPGQPKLDPSSFSLEDFEKALRNRSNGEVHISGEGDLYAMCSMAGWVGKNRDAFAMGFRIPKTAKSYQLFWPGNEPIDLNPNL